jgi:hypothetical protein
MFVPNSINRPRLPFSDPTQQIQQTVQPQRQSEEMLPPELSLPRFLNYYADYSG